MAEKYSPTELWSASLLGKDGIGRRAAEARRICNRWAEASMLRFVLISCLLFTILITWHRLSI